jgi:hypothetical protein
MKHAMAAIDPCLICCIFVFHSAVEILGRNDSTADRIKPEDTSNASPAGQGKASKKHSLRFIIPVLQLCITATVAQGGISGEK